MFKKTNKATKVEDVERAVVPNNSATELDDDVLEAAAGGLRGVDDITCKSCGRIAMLVRPAGYCLRCHNKVAAGELAPPDGLTRDNFLM